MSWESVLKNEPKHGDIFQRADYNPATYEVTGVADAGIYFKDLSSRSHTMYLSWQQLSKYMEDGWITPISNERLMEVELVVKIRLKVWGSNENHAWQRLRALQGETIAPYEGAGKSGHPIFRVESIEKVNL